VARYLPQVALGLTIAVAGLSGFEKARVVVEGRARWHPVVLNWPQLRAVAPIALATGGAFDFLIAAMMLRSESQVWASVTWAGTLAVYTLLGFRAIAASGTCGCLTGSLDASSRRELIIRNSLLIILSLSIALTRPEGAWGTLVIGVVSVALLSQLARSLRSQREGPKTAVKRI